METTRDEKYDNYVYHTICEKSMSIFEPTSEHKTYKEYCEFIAGELPKDQEIFQKNKQTVKHLINISDQLELQYSMNSVDQNHYIQTYFVEGKYLKFEKQVKEQQELMDKTIEE